MMKKTKFLSGVLAIALAASSLGVVMTDTSAEAAAKPKLSATKKTIKKGKSFKLTVKKVSGIKAISKVKWSADKKSIVSIKKSGKTAAKIIGKAAGKAKVTAKVTFKNKKGKKSTKKLVCKVTVKATPAKKSIQPAAPTAAPATQTQASSTTATSSETKAPVETATPEPTPEPTKNPYYYDKGYFATYDGSKSETGKDNLYINYVMADSKEKNKQASVITNLRFKIDTEESFEMGIYVNTWGEKVTDTKERVCDAAKLGEAARVGTFSTNGTKGQSVDVALSGAALEAIDNERITFAFYADPAKVDKDKQKYILHDMQAIYEDDDENVYPVSLSYNTVGCTSDAAGIYSTRQKDSSDIIDDKYQSLASLTEAKGYKFGTCVSYNQIKNDTQFKNLLKKHCDSITASNEFKAYSLLDQEACKASPDGMPTGMKYQQADEICEWAKENGLQIRGHALVWDQSMLQWFFNKDYEDNIVEDGKVINRVDKETMTKRLQSYIEQVIMHFQTKYPGVLYCWDVVNEGLTDEQNGSGGDKEHYYIRTTRDGTANPFYEVLGYEYIKIAFEAARDTLDKNNIQGIDLVYNDYNVFQTYNDKRNRVINLVKYLNEERKLVDTVGMQGYLGYGNQKNCLKKDLISGVKDTIVALQKAGVKVQLTEMAMRNFTNTDECQENHAEFAKNMFSMLADINETTEGAFTSMSLWAFFDDPTLNYKDDTYEYDIYTPYSGLFDETYAAKGSFFSIYEAFGGVVK
ncbi:MAG: endo-1,4-beta-xylanase [Eubacterium sp.]|nr:endo-1,4-beta-xylanase [Eubacterium sp.]